MRPGQGVEMGAQHWSPKKVQFEVRHIAWVGVPGTVSNLLIICKYIIVSTRSVSSHFDWPHSTEISLYIWFTNQIETIGKLDDLISESKYSYLSALLSILLKNRFPDLWKNFLNIISSRRKQTTIALNHVRGTIPAFKAFKQQIIIGAEIGIPHTTTIASFLIPAQRYIVLFLILPLHISGQWHCSRALVIVGAVAAYCSVNAHRYYYLAWKWPYLKENSF